MKSIALFIALCLLTSCEKKVQTSRSADLKTNDLPTEQIPTPASLKSSELPTATHSRPLEEKESHYIQIVISEDKTEIFHEGKPVATTTTPDQLHTELEQLWDKNNTMGYTSPLLISAPGSTSFSVIVDRIRTAANTGIAQIRFLVRSDQTSETRVVFIELPSMDQALPEIDPYFLHVTSEGQIYRGYGKAKFLLNGDKTDQQLIKLSEHLQIYSAAAKSLGTTNPPCQIYVEPNATYQRVIDVISLTNKFQINPFFTDRLPEPEPDHYRGPDFVPYPPSPPNSGVRPLGLAPKE